MAMNSQEPLVCLSPVDQDRFGIRTARAEQITIVTLPRVMEFCRREKVTLLITRCPTTDIRVAQALEKEGSLLTDTLILYRRNLIRPPIPEISGKFIIRMMKVGEEDTVKTVAEKAFHDYGGHYQADERLAKIGSGEIYSSWAYNTALSRDHDHDVVVAEQNGEIIGFTLIRMNNPAEGEGILEGVSPSIGKRSLVQRDMALGAKNWARSRGAVRFLASVLLTNTVMQKIISRMGYEPYRSSYTFHKWFTP